MDSKQLHIKDISGQTVTNLEKIKRRWKEYTRILYRRDVNIQYFREVYGNDMDMLLGGSKTIAVNPSTQRSKDETEHVNVGIF